jgi:photosystem II stability/assembly factor-like uncharacterized protein
VVAAAGDPANPLVFYFGAVNGGVWKTTNAGGSWENVTDGTSAISSVGAVAVAPSDHNVIWVGTGEACLREDLTNGNGVWRSTDGGQSWQHLGLDDTRHIAAVRVHPNDPDVAYVAAMGHAFGPNADRGVFRTTDGGKSWRKVLYIDAETGATDLTMDPTNPRILYAAMYRLRRHPWTLDAGGGRSGLWKSTDGGDTWTEITRNPGMPPGLVGRIGVAASPARSGRIWASVERPPEDSTGGIFRSDDGGRTWERVNGDQKFMVRPWYYSHVTADPADENTVYVLNLQTWRSTDGGRTFTRIQGIPHGDHHLLWIDPANPRRMIHGNDGGGTVSLDGGSTWSTVYNQPTAQFYHVVTDTQWPYYIYGAQQDNTSIRIRSRSDDGTIGERDYHNTGGGESGYIAVRADDPNIVFGGSYMGKVTRWDFRTRQTRDVSLWQNNWDGRPVSDAPFRFAWTFPIVLSPHDPNKLYVGGDRVYMSTNEGHTWAPISPDLTVHDPATMRYAGGPVTGENTGAEWYATVYTFAESPRQAGVLWAGSDDGLVHVSRDAGKSWQNVTPPGIGKFTKMSIIDPSPHDAGTAYLAANRYQQDDFRPYLFKTTDYGRTWTRIVAGIPGDAYTRSIREDPARRGLLYAGTERGIYVSFDDGAHWQSLQLNLPIVSVRDLIVKDNDLIAATHGRSFWVLDDVTPLRQMADSVRRADAFLFAPAPAVRWMGGQGSRRNAAVGANPPDGAIIDFHFRERPRGPVTLTLLDPAGREIRTYTSAKADSAKAERDSAPPVAAARPATPDTAASARGGARPTTPDSAARGATTGAAAAADSASYVPADSIVPARRGGNRFVWNLRYPDVHLQKDILLDYGTARGPIAVPGTYTVRLTADGRTLTRQFTVVADPRVKSTPQDFEAQHRLLVAISAQIDTLSTTVERIESMQRQLRDRAALSKGAPHAARVDSASKALVPKLEAVRAELTEVHSHADQISEHYPVKIYNQLLTLNDMVQSADAAPTQAQLDSYKDLVSQTSKQRDRLAELERTELAAFNAMMKQLDVPAVVVVPTPGVALTP